MEFTKKEKEYIYFVLEDRKELEPIFDNPFKIPQRIRDFDKDVFICYNSKRSRYEIHSLESFYLSEHVKNWSTYQADWYLDFLDDRILDYLYMNSFKIHGYNLIKELDEEYDLMEKQKDNIASRNMDVVVNRSIKNLEGETRFY